MGNQSSPIPAPVGSARATSTTVDRQIAFERINTLYAITQPMLFAGFAFTVLTGLLLAASVPQSLLAGWVAFKITLTVARLVDGRMFLRDRHRLLRIRVWKVHFFVGVVLDSLAWGLLPVLFMPTADPAINGVLIAGMVGIASAGTIALAAHRLASGLSLLLVLGPLIEQQATAPTILSRYTAAAAVVYGALLFLEARNSHRRFTETMRLRFENAAIAEERHRALVYAEHSNAAKTRFLASVSHELRTPLNGIIGMTQLVAVEPLSALQRQRLDVLRHSAEHLVTVIGDLLDLSRIEFDRIEIDAQPTLIAQTVRDVTDLLQPVAAERGLDFEVVFDLGLPAAALMDASRVKQVLHNLIGNALKFTAHGGVGVAAAMAEGMLCFRVSDSGEGIPHDAIERIFDAFEQGPSSTVPARSGTGLGLTISRRLARAMGGDVTCRSIPGRGTTFEFTIAFRPTPRTPTPRPSLAEERGLAFEVVFDLGLPAAAQMDASRVKQVLHNLIGNALKFTAHGEVGLAVAMADGLLRFRVSDSGEGIPPDAIERIFDAFEQAPSNTAPARSGAGLGLTISRRLARAMGGDVTCRSVPGLGTTFEFTITFKPTPRTPTPRPSLSEELAAADRPRGGADMRPGRVLVVEDNEVNALVVRGMLEQMGVNAELAVDGQKALVSMGQTAFDLVLMDCQMPVLDGWEATRLWRAREIRMRQYMRTPIIALTASAAAGERERCLEAGMDDYLSKPFSREALGELVDRYLPPVFANSVRSEFR